MGGIVVLLGTMGTQTMKLVSTLHKWELQPHRRQLVSLHVDVKLHKFISLQSKTVYFGEYVLVVL